jgi:hypothetical protein
MPSIPVRNFGKHSDQVSALGLGGHHLGDAQDEQTAVQIVHEAIEGGITFFDNCWEYNRGKSENWMGEGLVRYGILSREASKLELWYAGGSPVNPALTHSFCQGFSSARRSKTAPPCRLMAKPSASSRRVSV